MLLITLLASWAIPALIFRRSWSRHDEIIRNAELNDGEMINATYEARRRRAEYVGALSFFLFIGVLEWKTALHLNDALMAPLIICLYCAFGSLLYMWVFLVFLWVFDGRMPDGQPALKKAQEITRKKVRPLVPQGEAGTAQMQSPEAAGLVDQNAMQSPLDGGR